MVLPPPPSAPLASAPSSLPGGIITISGAVLLRQRGEEETLGGPEVGEKIEVKDEWAGGGGGGDTRSPLTIYAPTTPANGNYICFNY